MPAIGFSTGALARGDFAGALQMMKQHCSNAVELSALRDHELPELMSSIDDLDLSGYEYVSVHAPSSFRALSEARSAELLLPCIERGWPVVLHPDAISDPACWDDFQENLCLENMDKRKSDARTTSELAKWFDRFPAARFCLDLAHSRQIDPSMLETLELIRAFCSRLQQVHLSELNASSQHRRLSLTAIASFQEIAELIAPVAVILESCVDAVAVSEELNSAHRVFMHSSRLSKSAP